MRWLPLVALLLIPDLAFAKEGVPDYYAYNAFNETVGGFQRLALFTQNKAFLGLTFAMVGFAYFAAVVMYAIRGTSGQHTPAQTMFVPLIAGVTILIGGIIPNGNLDIYDPVTNQYQRVGDIPNVIRLLASGLNSFERAVVEIVDAASLSGASPYEENAGPMSFVLIYNAMGASGTDVNLEASIAQYYTDCVETAIATNRNGLTRAEVRRSTDDMMASFAKANHPAWPTVWYEGDNGAGTPGYCSDAWSYISDQIGNDATMEPMTTVVCKKSGFDPAVPAQLAICKTRIGEAAEVGFGEAALSSAAFLRNFVMARSMSRALNSADYSLSQRQLVNRQLMAEGFGAAEAMGQWVPKLRGYLVATVLGLSAILLVFIATPLTFKVLSVIFGLFIWLSMWGVTDVMSVAMAKDQAVSALTQVQHFHLSFEAIMNSPEGAVQALAIYGKARSMALMLSTFICSALFAFGGYALTSYAQSWQSHIDQAGESAGRRTALPEEQSALQQGLNAAPATAAQQAQFGYSATAGTSNRSTAQASSDFAYISDEIAGTHGRMPQFYADTAARRGGAELGELGGTRELADRRGTNIGGVARDTAAISSERSGSSTLEYGDVAEQHGGTMAVSEAAGALDAGRNAAIGRSADHVPGAAPRSPDAYGRLGAFERSQSDGTMRGAEGDPERIRGNYERMTRQETEQTHVQNALVSPEQVGAARGRSEAISAKGLDAYLQDNPNGIRDLAAGAEVRHGEQAGSGAAARNLGDPGRVGERFGRFGTISQYGRYVSQQEVADAITGENGDASLFRYAKDSNREGTTTLKGEALDRVLDNIVAQDPGREAWADRVREIGAARMNFGVASDGSFVHGELKGGFESWSGDFNTRREGSSITDEHTVAVRQSDDYLLSASREAVGGNALLDHPYVDTLMRKAFKPDGEVDQTWFATFGKAYGGALKDRAISLGSISTESFEKFMRGDVHASADGTLSQDIGLPIGPKARWAITAGLSANAGASKAWNEQASTTTDGNVIVTQALAADAVASAKAEYEKVYGPYPQADAPDRTIADNYIYGVAADKFRNGFEDIAKESKQRGANDLESSSPIHQAELLLKNKEEGAPRAAPVDGIPGQVPESGSWLMH